MKADEQTQRGVNFVANDRTGKVFAPVGRDMLLCLICENVFTRQSSREHARSTCRLAVAEVADYSAHFPVCVTYLPVAER